MSTKKDVTHCHDPRHATPCPLPCSACVEEGCVKSPPKARAKSATPPRFIGVTLREIRRDRKRLWEKFQEQGGRGIEIADQIDLLDGEIERREALRPERKAGFTVKPAVYAKGANIREVSAEEAKRSRS
jgi:hypothetical protein